VKPQLSELSAPAQSDRSQCPNCLTGSTWVFYEVPQVPVHSVLLMATRETALRFRRGDISLGFCESCGFVSNMAFDPDAHSYSQQYEETQGFSPTFQAFHLRLAQSLIEKYDIRGKRIVEIGCGKGEFLSLLCELGNNTGVGFDPAFVSGRNSAPDSSRLVFVQDFYGEANADVDADVICCKMTLEHIYDTRRFIETVRRSIGKRRDTLVFFQVPDFGRILRDDAFWDIYYEHCSYFTSTSLRNLFEMSGFEVISLSTEYDGQYLQIVAVPASRPQRTVVAPQIASIESAVERFAERSRKKIAVWNDVFSEVADLNPKAVLWGSGSKAVAFLSAIKDPARIEYVVDINPYRHGHYMAGTAQEIVSPEFLVTYQPDMVVVMNPIYCNEIRKKLDEIGCEPRLLAV
jgi:SAM-dependent methyltransferase